MQDRAYDASGCYRFAFVVEQNLGHRTHYRNLVRYVGEDRTITPTWLPIEFETAELLYRLPVLRSNVSVRSSVQAWQALRRERRAGRWDAIFYHTQTPSLLSPLHPGTPSVISLDATPINFDEVGLSYGHASGGPLEAVKARIYRRVFARARALITWSRWAKESLVRDYGVPGEKITVVAPGVDLGLWPSRNGRDPIAAAAGRLPRLLFVGGDFTRKGGEVLLRCFREGLDQRCELHVVTQTKLAPARNLFVYNDVTPNSEKLLQLYADADLFVFPTLADCFAQVVPEAMAAGLPVITTRVGATPEIVTEGETGLLVRPGDSVQLRKAIDRLLSTPELRASMSEKGRRRVEQECDVRVNARRVLQVLKDATRRAREPESGRTSLV